MVVNNRLGYLFVFLGMSMALYAQRKTEVIRYGDLDQWVVRKITESAIIGKETKTLYCVGPMDTIIGNKPFEPKASPWGSSNVMARVSGITKASVSVYPERRDEGYCARLETGIESISAMGIMNVKVLVGGCLYLGRFLEPAKNSSETWGQIVCGIPFHQKPTSLLFDYKVKLSGDPNRIKLSGFSKRSEVNGIDMPLVNLFLQKRWEDKDGNIFAKRVGTMVVRYYNTTDWRNNATYSIMYGDITGDPAYKPHMMRLQVEERYAINSKGESVPVKEVAWGTEEDAPTHLLLQFTSSHGGAYIGSPGNSLWIDNVKLVY